MAKLLEKMEQNDLSYNGKKIVTPFGNLLFSLGVAINDVTALGVGGIKDILTAVLRPYY